MDVPIITPEECKIILKKYSKSSRFFSFTIKSLAEEVEGYLASHYSLTIRYVDEENQSQSVVFFMKKQANYPGFLPEMAKTLDVYNKENFLYNLYPYLKGMKNFKEFAPTCYYSKADLLVIENLCNSNFYITERNVLYNLEECKSALQTLALFHASCIAYEEKKSLETGKIFRLDLEYPKELEDKFYTLDENSPTYKFFAASIKLILDLVDAIQDETINKEELKNLILQEDENPNQFEYFNKFRNCWIHGDLWSKNIMFKKTDNKITDCRLIDFQLLRYFLPSFDVVLFLSYNTSYKFRQIHREELVQFYYDFLDKQLEDYGINCSKIIPYQDLLDGIILTEPSAKIQALNDIALTRLPESLAVECMSNPELMQEILIDKRSEYVLDIYKSNHDFKEMIIEEILDLSEALEQKQYYVNNNTML